MQFIQTACIKICKLRFNRVLFSNIDTPGLDFADQQELKLERQVNGILKFIDAQCATRRTQSSLPTKTRSETTISYHPPDLVPDDQSLGVGISTGNPQVFVADPDPIRAKPGPVPRVWVFAGWVWVQARVEQTRWVSMGAGRMSGDASLGPRFTTRTNAATSIDVHAIDAWYPEVLGTPRTRFKHAWVCRSDLQPAVVQNGDGDNNDKDDNVAVVTIAVVIVAVVIVWWTSPE